MIADVSSLPPEEIADLGIAAWQKMVSYDPASDLRRIRVPFLAILGGKDEDTPSAPTAKNQAKNLKAAGNRDVTIKIFPGVYHSLCYGRNENDPGFDTFADGYFNTLAEWLKAHLR